MKKWMLLIAVAVAAVIAVGIYYFVCPESSEYSGSTYSADCTMSIDNDSFELTITEYQDNCYLSTRCIYDGKIISDRFTVQSMRTQHLEFGKVYGETVEKDMSVPLSDIVFFREVNGGYLVKDVYIKKSINTMSTSLLYVTTEEALNNAGSDITLIKDSTKSDIAEMTIVEIYSDGTSKKYSVDAGRISDTNLNTLGKKSIAVGYGDGRTANLTLNIIPFMIEDNEIMDRGTSFEYAQTTGKIVLNKADGVGDITAEGWDSTDGTRRIWLSCGDYKVSALFTFTSDSDRSVRDASVGIEHFTAAGTELPVFGIHMELNNGKVYDIQSDDPQVTLSGYDKNVTGPQNIRVTYLGSQFEVILYSYNDSNLIPKEAHLINVNKLYDSKDSLLLYTDRGLNYGNYAIRYQMCDGSVRTACLTDDMVTFAGMMDIQKRTSTTAYISKVIETYRYTETVSVRYDTTEETIKNSLTISNIIGDRTSAYYSMVTSGGTYSTSFGYRFDDFYIAHDNIDSSSYRSNYVGYRHSDSDSFVLYLKDCSIDMGRSILESSRLVKYTIDHDGVLYAEFSAVMTAEDIEFFSGFGFAVGDTVTFDLTFDGPSGMVTEMDISKDGVKLAEGTFVYGSGVMLSKEVKKYVENSGTVTVVMKYDDGRSDHHFSVNAGIKDLRFECDEGYGVFMKDGKDMIPFQMPAIGLTTSVSLYYLRV